MKIITLKQIGVFALCMLANLTNLKTFGTTVDGGYTVMNKAKQLIEARAEGNSTIELLEDPFFYSFDGSTPSKWQTAGTVTQLSGSERYSSDTGFGVGIETNNEIGAIRQTIDLKTVGKEVVENDELECLIHYYTLKTEQEGGPFRLALKWLNATGEEIVTAEKDFINNSELYFGRAKAYGVLKFRTICPAGAEKLEFAVEVAPKSAVYVDDFSVLRLAEKDKTPLVAILPQYRTIYGEVGASMDYLVAMQGMHLAADQTPNFRGTDAGNVLKLDVEKLPMNGTTKAKLTVTPSKKGVFVGSNAYVLKFAGADAENSGSLTMMSYFKAAGTTPTIKLKESTQVRAMTAEVGKTDEQTLEFDITDVITNVDLALAQQTNGTFRISVTQFYYAASSGKLYNGPVKVTFNPKEEGEYKAVLKLSTALADTLKIELTGTCKAAVAETIVEKFTADRQMDSRFTGEAWHDYHKFDLGYWKLNGKWNASGDVTLDKDGMLYCDEQFANGIGNMKMEPAASAAMCKAEYSIDGGGHWTALGNADAQGTFVVNTHRPTLVRFVANSEVAVNQISIVPNAIEARETFAKLEDAMIKGADAEPLKVINETFTGLRHTRLLGLNGWQNICVRGERPFYAWQQKNIDQTAIENEVAQISFLKYGAVDKREHETWLISPTLSYKNADSKILTFSLRYQNPTQDGGELFGLYIITEKDGLVKEHYLNLVDYAPQNVTLEADTWYDYRIDLSKVEGLVIDDNFHVAYSFYSPVGGNETSLNFMVDDLSFGRTDLPELTTDQTLINFYFQAGLEAQPQAFNVTAQRATAPVTVTLVPSTMKKYFKIAPTQLDKAGGAVAVGFKSDDETARAALLLIQTRGAEPVTVKLLAQLVGSGIEDVVGESELMPVVATEEIRVKGEYEAFELYSTSGQLLKKGRYQEVIGTANLNAGVVLLKLTTKQGEKVFALMLK